MPSLLILMLMLPSFSESSDGMAQCFVDHRLLAPTIAITHRPLQRMGLCAGSESGDTGQPQQRQAPGRFKAKTVKGSMFLAGGIRKTITTGIEPCSKAIAQRPVTSEGKNGAEIGVPDNQRINLYQR